MATFVSAIDGVSLRGYRTARVPMNQTNSDTLWPEYEAVRSLFNPQSVHLTRA